MNWIGGDFTDELIIVVLVIERTDIGNHLMRILLNLVWNYEIMKLCNCFNSGTLLIWIIELIIFGRLLRFRSVENKAWICQISDISNARRRKVAKSSEIEKWNRYELSCLAFVNNFRRKRVRFSRYIWYIYHEGLTALRINEGIKKGNVGYYELIKIFERAWLLLAIRSKNISSDIFLSRAAMESIYVFS